MYFLFILSFYKEHGDAEGIVLEEHSQQVQSYVEKVAGIRDILARDRMKVAFFGRYDY